MKINHIVADFSAVEKAKKYEHRNPVKPNILFRSIIRIAASKDLKETGFTYTKNIKRAGKGPYLILMNHSSFIDLEIMSRILYPKPYCIVCTNDGFVGKEWLMRQIGCIPTYKFVSDVSLIGDMKYALKDLNTSVLMYPEASYTFDGTATPLPRHLGLLLKKLDVPVLMVKTEGAFTRDPLYNCLQKRNVKVSAHMSCLFTRDEIKEKSVDELDAALDDAFTFDNFKWQQENKVKVSEPFRADGLNRILYKCPHCKKEGTMEGKGTTITCNNCGVTYELDEYGKLENKNGETKFDSIPGWYQWERECVRKELCDGTYSLKEKVNIGILKDLKNIYMVGSGTLIHNENGFSLTGCDGKINYTQSPLSSYSLYSDYYWYEIGDMICIGDKEMLYYCFPTSGHDIVAKTRMAAEELYKIKKKEKEEQRKNRKNKAE